MSSSVINNTNTHSVLFVSVDKVVKCWEFCMDNLLAVFLLPFTIFLVFEGVSAIRVVENPVAQYFLVIAER